MKVFGRTPLKPHIWFDYGRAFWICSYKSSFEMFFEFGKGKTPLEAYNAWKIRFSN